MKPDKKYYNEIKAKIKDKCSSENGTCGGFWEMANKYCDYITFCQNMDCKEFTVCFYSNKSFARLGKELGYEK